MGWTQDPARFELLIRVPVHVPAGARARALVLPGKPVPGWHGSGGHPFHCLGRVEDVAGLAWEGALSGNRLTLLSGDEPREGALLLAWSFGNASCPPGFYDPMPPGVLELELEELEYLARWTTLPTGEAADTEPFPRFRLDDLKEGAPAEVHTFGPELTAPRSYAIAVIAALVLGTLAAVVLIFVASITWAAPPSPPTEPRKGSQ